MCLQWELTHSPIKLIAVHLPIHVRELDFLISNVATLLTEIKSHLAKALLCDWMCCLAVLYSSSPR